MPYDNPQNRAVKREVDLINKRYVAHTDMNGMTNAINWVNPAVEPEGQILSGFGHMGRIVGGGVGCATFHRASASKHYEEDKDGMSGGAILGLQDGTLAGDRTKPISRVRKFKAEKDTDNKERFGALGNALPSDIGLSDQNVPAAKFQQGYAQKDDSPLETQPASFARALGFNQAQGSGRSGGRRVSPIAHLDKQAERLEKIMQMKSHSSMKTKLMQLANKLADTFDSNNARMNEEEKEAYKAFSRVVQQKRDELEAHHQSKSKKAPKKAPREPSPDDEGAVPVMPRRRGRGKKAPCPCGAKTKKKCKCALEGGNGFASGTHMDTGFGETFGAADNGGVKNSGNLSLSDTPRKKLRGKGNAKVGGAILGLVKPSTSKLADNSVAPGTTAKPTLKSTAKKAQEKLTEKAQMPSSTLSGMAKPKRQASAKAKERAQIVKKVMQEKGLSLPQASKYVKEHNLF